MVDLKGRQLIDKKTVLAPEGRVYRYKVSILSASEDQKFGDTLLSSPSVIRPVLVKNTTKLQVKHILEITGQPVFAKIK